MFCLHESKHPSIPKLRTRTILRRHSPTPIHSYAVTGIRLSPIHTGMKIKRPSCWEQPAAVHGILATWISSKRFSFRFVGLTADSKSVSFGRKKELPAFFQPSLFPGPWDSHVPSVLEWKQGELFPVFRIGFRSVEGGDAPQFA